MTAIDIELLEWTLLPEEINFIRENARRAENLIRYAVQMCCLRLSGRFIRVYSLVSLKICNYLARQLMLELLCSGLTEPAPSTETRIRRQISEFLEFTTFNESAQDLIKDWLSKNSELIADKKTLSVAIEKFLVKEKIMLPAQSQLMRVVFNLYAKQQYNVFDIIASSLSVAQKKFIDDICNADNTDINYKLLVSIRRPMGDPNVKNILLKIEALRKLRPLKFTSLKFESLDASYIEKLSKLVDHYDRSALRRINPPAKRYTMLACHLYEITIAAIDQVIDANDKLLGEIERRINRDFEQYEKKLKERGRISQNLALETLKNLLTHQRRQATTIQQFCDEIGNEKLKKAVSDYEEIEAFDYRGKAQLAKHRYSYLRDYIEQFLELDFHASRGSEKLLQSIKTLLRYRKLRIAPILPAFDFIDSPWKHGLYDATGKFDIKAWELGLFFAVRKALRSGSLYVPQSKNHREFWAPLYNKTDWNANKTTNYEDLKLPQAPKRVINALQKEFLEHFNRATASFIMANAFAGFKNDKLVIHTDQPLPVSSSLQDLQNLVESHFEPIRIEKLLTELQKKTNYLKAFKPIEGFDPKTPLQLPILNAAITAHGTNLGLYGISKSTKGISIDKLRHVSNWYITTDNLKEANQILINAQQQYWLTSILGKGERSSSDAQRFVINKKSVIGSIYPRDFGALVRGIGVYTHMSDQFTVFSTQVISCSVREALYVLEGFLDNQSMIQCTVHSTDTHGFTEIIFAMMYLLGISFQPHFKDLKNQQLYCFDRKNIPQEYIKMFSQEKIKVELICQQWDDIIRLVYSLKRRLIKPHVIIQKLNNQQATTDLAKALTHLGRLVKTIYILRYLYDCDMRRAVRLQLNRLESRHSLVRNIFFADQGTFKTNDYTMLMNQASCLSFLSNAIVLHNTERLQNIYELLKNQGYPIQEIDMARISPLSSKHITMHGIYNFNENDNDL
jgi:TnpA family transposase